MHRSLSICAAVIALGLLKPTPGCCGPEPVYGGRPLSESLSELARDSNSVTSPGAREPARQVIRHIGTNALPFLLDEVVAMEAICQKEGWARFPGLGETSRRRHTIFLVFEVLGPVAKPISPALVELVKAGKDPSLTAIRSLIRIDPGTADPLVAQQLTNQSWDVRCHVADWAFELRTNGVITTPALIRCLKEDPTDKHNSYRLRVEALSSLRAIGPQSEKPTIIAAITGCLADPDSRVRMAAVIALSRLREYAQPARPSLQKLCTNDPDPLVRTTAQKAIRSIDSAESVAPSAR